MRAVRLFGYTTLVAALALGNVACSDDDDPEPDPFVPDPIEEISNQFATALHATGRGMAYWYAAEQGGFEIQTGIPYENLSCAGCHTPARCDNCHSTVPGQVTVTQATCLGCHGRQKAEILKQLPDVHRDAGMTCLDCHSLKELHGDGTAYVSMFEEGARDVTCETCHESISATPSHEQHGDDIACASCHMTTSVTCVNCHFAAEVEDGRKQAFAQVSGWQMLGNFDGKVHPMNFQSVEFGEETFVAYGPYVGHTISPSPRDCGDCHGNFNARTYLQDGDLKLVEWNATENRLVPMQGVIPIPPDYATTLIHDFATFENGSWRFLETGPDRTQMLYGTPLSAEQVQRLANPASGNE